MKVSNMELLREDRPCVSRLGVRAAAAESLPQLLDCAKLRGDDYVRQMWQYMNKELFKAIEIEPDHEVLGELFLSLGKVNAALRM